jgi:hypothetical protein
MDPIDTYPEACINGGEIEAIKRIVERDHESDSFDFVNYYINEIAESCNLATFRWAIKTIRKRNTSTHWEMLIESASKEGRLDLLSLLHKYCNWTPVIGGFGWCAAYEAATHGQVGVLAWLQNNDLIEDDVIIGIIEAATFEDSAASDNSTKVLKFVRRLIESRDDDDDDDDNDNDNDDMPFEMEYNDDVWHSVLTYGIHDFIDVLYDHMYGIDMADFTEDCAYLAGLANLDTEGAEVSFGHAECLRFLRSRGFPWNPDEATRARAAAIGIE